MGWQLVPTGIGWREFSRVGQRGQFSCSNPTCKGRKAARQEFELRSGRNWFTVLFIPLIPLNSTGTWVRCAACKTVHPASVLSRASAAPAAVSPTAPAPTPTPAAPSSVPPAPAMPLPVPPAALLVPEVPGTIGSVAASLPEPPPALRSPGALPGLVWADGALLVFDTVAVIGREPVARPDDPRPLLVPVAGDALVSKTHLAVGRSGAGVLWVEDRHSTNGVIVARGDESLQVPAGVRLPLGLGDSVVFGQQRLTVTAAAADAVTVPGGGGA